jgi:hypothetical protein
VPTFPPGSDQHVNLGPTPTWIFTANTSASNTLKVLNEGLNTFYVGGSAVTPATGTPVAPGSKTELINVTQTLYGCSNVIGASSVSTTAAVISAGSTAFTTATSVSTIVAGSIVLIGTGASAEPGSVKSTGGATTTTFTLATATNLDHAAASPVSLATMFIGQARVTQGVV